MNHPDVQASPPDYLGLHYYGTESADAQKYIEDMHKTFPDQKVIVSEIASISRNQPSVVGFTIDMCNWMDEQDWLFEYAFFGCMTQVPDSFVSPAARLMEEDGSFTSLMDRYMNQQPMKGD
jgi:acyl carrier protein phosphodiesterase